MRALQLCWHRPESHGERDDINEGVDLKDAEKKYPKMLESLREEVPKQAQVGSLIRHRQSEEKNHTAQSHKTCDKRRQSHDAMASSHDTVHCHDKVPRAHQLPRDDEEDASPEKEEDGEYDQTCDASRLPWETEPHEMVTPRTHARVTRGTYLGGHDCEGEEEHDGVEGEVRGQSQPEGGEDGGTCRGRSEVICSCSHYRSCLATCGTIQQC